MSPFPTETRDRWQNRTEPQPGQGTVYWHMLLRDHPEVRAAAKAVQERISHLGGFHMTPEKWLHMTTLVAGSTAQISRSQMKHMLSIAQKRLSGIEPIPVSIGKILYHPEAIMLDVHPKNALDPVLQATQEATRSATGEKGSINESPTWNPHVTVSYSTAQQPIEPIVSTLGKELPSSTVVVDSVSLVIQWGPERLWDWEPVGTVHLGKK